MKDNQAPERLKTKNLWPAALLLAILTIGALLTWLSAVNTDHEMRADLLQAGAPGGSGCKHSAHSISFWNGQKISILIFT